MAETPESGMTDLDLESLARKFGWPEYAVFGVLLASSAAIGIYHGCFGNKQKSNVEFLLGSRQMSAFPVALSLLCSFISANTMIGNPVEIYYFGVPFMLSLLSYIPLTLTLSYFYAPVFLDLKLTSAYEYFELRFNRRIRVLMSIISIIYVIFYMGLVVYGPALALAQVTGMNLRALTAIIFLVCIFYSSLGGMKAVLWTDTLQAIVMICSLILVVWKGASDIGGFSVVWERAKEANRTDLFNFDFDPRTRHTFWTGTIGMFFVWLPTYAATQANIQRYVCMPDIRTVRRALWINMAGLFLTIGLILTAGLVIFARYHDCDPVSKKIVTSPDQLMPLFVMDVMGEYSGLPGVFVAGITSASLSSVSSGLNALAAIITEDYVKQYKPNMSDENMSKMSKLISMVSGLFAFGFVFAAERMGSIYSAGVSMFGMIMGPTLGLFTLGMFLPWANSSGALIGVIISFITTGFIALGSTIAQNQRLLPDQRLPLSTIGCLNETRLIEQDLLRSSWKDRDDSWHIQLLSTSFIWHAGYGCLSTILFGLVFSLILRQRYVLKINSRYISPPMLRLWKWWCPKSMNKLLY